MTNRQYSALFVVFGAFVATPFACAPQVVDAVDPATESGGSQATGGGGGGGEGDTGGSATTGGSGGASGGTSGTGTYCPDGGSSDDRDGDGWLDCEDQCPDDPTKRFPVTCGCGLPDDLEDGGVTCQDLQPLLQNRYTFDGTGTRVRDTKSGADGQVSNTELTGQGTVVLQGAQTNQYVALPSGRISALTSTTLEAWLEWTGEGGAWQRIFDFGEQNAALNGISYLFLTPRTPNEDTADPGYNGPYMRAVYGRESGVNVIEMRANADLNGRRIFPSGSKAHVAVVVDGDTGSMYTYIDGDLVGLYEPETTPPIELSLINDVNCWLGRSNYERDPRINATFHEFRIYNAALTAEQIALSYQAGPDPIFFP